MNPPFLLLLQLALCFCIIQGMQGDDSIHQYKIHKLIHKHYEINPHTSSISSMVLLHDSVDIEREVASIPFKERGQKVFDVLNEAAFASQPAVVKMLEGMGVKYRTYWLVNMIVIETDYKQLLSIAKHDNVRDVHPNFEFAVPLETPDVMTETETAHHADAPDAIEWNINRVKAPEVWNLGYTGVGYTVAIADTGVQWNHPALIQQYRGYKDASSVDHNYNWWDAVHATGSKCGASSAVPCDDNGHGTHTAGTAAGSDHASNQIGVAPGAKWIGCRNMNAGNGSPVLYIECLQFFVAPTDLKGAHPDPTRRPHAIGNSYGCPASEGCVADSLLVAVTRVIAAGIFMSVSAGNSGSACSTISEPPAIYKNVFSVGALGQNSNTIASYSSRGPVTVDKSNTPKPEITAPGSGIRSSYPTNSYASLSGTSMASPHITGIIALLYQAHPELERDIVKVTSRLIETAIPRASSTCGGNATFNNVYGFGEVDVLAAATHKV